MRVSISRSVHTKSSARRSDRTGKSSERRARAMLLAPPVALLTIGFLMPIMLMGWLALSDPTFGLQNLGWVLNNSTQRDVLFRTFTTAAKVTTICIVLAYPYAYAMVVSRRKTLALLVLLVVTPFWTSLIIRTFAWVILLQDAGLVNRGIGILGLGPFDIIRTNIAVVIGMSQVLLPFMVLPLYAVMRNIDRRLILASSSLGARPVTSFWRIWLPLSLPGVSAGALIVFISSLGFYVTPALLGSPGDSLVSQQIFTQIVGLLKWGRGAALGLFLLSATFVMLGSIWLLSRIESSKWSKEMRR